MYRYYCTMYSVYCDFDSVQGTVNSVQCRGKGQVFGVKYSTFILTLGHSLEKPKGYHSEWSAFTACGGNKNQVEPGI